MKITVGPTFVFAHEFFDALPVHAFEFQKASGWHERLVNISHNQE